MARVISSRSLGVVCLRVRFGFHILQPIRPRLGAGPDACNVRIFAAGIDSASAPFTLSIFEASGVLFLIAFLLRFFSCPLV
jgi:hypothetical protein